MTAADLHERSFQFACRIVRLCRGIAVVPGIHRQISGQLLRAGTSIGANLEEAKSAHTKREFACKLGIVLREAREALYWLRLIDATGLDHHPDVPDLVREANELVAIFAASVRKARASVNDPRSRSQGG